MKESQSFKNASNMFGTPLTEYAESIPSKNTTAAVAYICTCHLLLIWYALLRFRA